MFLDRYLKQASFDSKKRIYLDYAAATPLLPEAKVAMEPFLTSLYGNPSAIHTEGRIAKKAVEEAREKIASVLAVRPECLTFTSGGTEANNIAIYGLVRMLHSSGRAFSDMEIISTKLEHPSITEVLTHLEEMGVKVHWCGVDQNGKLDERELYDLLSDNTILVSTAYINSEIGTVQDVHHLSRIIKKYNHSHSVNIALHIDAAQAPLWVTCQPQRLGADIVTLDTGKCNGPKGVGVVVTMPTVSLLPVLLGGGQESGVRAGTENVAGIVGAAVSIEHAQRTFKERSQKVTELRDFFIEKLLELEGVVLNGSKGESRVANNVNISLLGLDTEYALIVLDEHGVAASTKSACSGAGSGKSEVVHAISNDEQRAKSTLRFTLHEDISKADIEQVVTILKEYQTLMGKI